MKFVKLIIIGALTFVCFACGKEFLEVKRDKSQVVPSSIADFQSILDRWMDMNLNSSHSLSIIGADEYYITDDAWQLLSKPYQKNGYIWAEHPYGEEPVDDWDGAYFRILLSNLILEGIQSIDHDPTDQKAKDNVKGSALFFRAWNYYQLTQVFCKPYSSATASMDMGLPLRTQTDVTVKTGRSSLEETYQLIIGDLAEATDLLPDLPINKMRPSKAAALALLARVYLIMGDFPQAKRYANRSLDIESRLLDFNSLNLGSNQLLPLDYGASNPEMLFFSALDNVTILNISRFHADSALLSMYAADDLRLKGYYRDIGGGRMIFKGSYYGTILFFTGLATDELYLILAECYAREGNLLEAHRFLNTLLANRYKKETFTPITMENQDALLRFILDERRKELVLRGIRWDDLRRLNQLEYGETLQRRVLGTTYELAPNSSRWTWPLPDNEVDLSKMPQNR